MLRHVVLWTFKESFEGSGKADIVAKVTGLLQRCADQIPSIRTFELGQPGEGYEATYDLILISTFDDAAGLQEYIEHPVHQEAVAYIGQVRETRACMDYAV